MPSADANRREQHTAAKPTGAGASTARRTVSHRPNVLVLLASYNGAKWIPEQIQSILAQRDVDLEITVRDDGSSDGTLRELARFANNPVRLSESSNPTGSAAQNFFNLIRDNDASGFDLVAFSDQDDVWNHDKLLRACRVLSQSRSSGYSSATIARWEDGKQRLIALHDRQNTSDFLFEGAGQGCTFVLSAACYQRVRNFLEDHPALTDGIHFHDWAIYALVRSWGLQWAFDPEPSMIYRQHGRNDIGARSSIGAALKRLKLIRNGWYRRQIGKIALLCATAAPGNARIADWNSLLAQPYGPLRTIRSTKFCLQGGRRRMLDNAILLIGCIAGWI